LRDHPSLDANSSAIGSVRKRVNYLKILAQAGEREALEDAGLLGKYSGLDMAVRLRGAPARAE